VSLGGCEHRQQTGRTRHHLLALRHLNLAVDDEQQGPLVDLVLLKLLAGR